MNVAFNPNDSLIAAFRFEPLPLEDLIAKFGDYKPTKAAEKDEAIMQQDRLEYYQDLRMKALKAPLLSKLVATGYLGRQRMTVVEGTEQELLGDFWQRWMMQGQNDQASLLSWGLNINTIAIRSAVAGVTPPAGAFAVSMRGYRSMRLHQDLRPMVDADDTLSIGVASMVMGGPRAEQATEDYLTDLKCGSVPDPELTRQSIWDELRMAGAIAASLGQLNPDNDIRRAIDHVSEFPSTAFSTPLRYNEQPEPAWHDRSVNIYDIETRRKPDRYLLDLYGDFDPTKIKVPKSQSKKPGDAEAYLAKCHAEYLPGLRDKACLHGVTAEVSAIGYIVNGAPEVVIGTEQEVLADHWRRRVETPANGVWAGWNSGSRTDSAYDTRMLISRSRIAGVPVPQELVENIPGGGYGLKQSHDLEVMFTGKPQENLKLEVASRSVGGPVKNGSGAFFSDQLDSGDKEEIDKALAYLINDNLMLAWVAKALNLGDFRHPEVTPENANRYLVTPTWPGKEQGHPPAAWLDHHRKHEVQSLKPTDEDVPYFFPMSSDRSRQIAKDQAVGTPGETMSAS